MLGSASRKKEKRKGGELVESLLISLPLDRSGTKIRLNFQQFRLKCFFHFDMIERDFL